MKKILTLDTKDFLSGVSEIAYGNRGGLFFSADGVAPFVSPRKASKDFGLLQTFSAPTDMTSTIVDDVPFVWASEATGSNAGYLYIMGNGGHFYVVVLFTNAITDERSGGVITDPAIGLVIYNEDLFYAQKVQVGRAIEGTPPFDSSSTWDDDWSTAVGGSGGITSSIYHPMHIFSGRLWVGDFGGIDLISGAQGAQTYTDDVITFDSDYRVLCLEDDGYYLVAGLTKNKGDNSIMGETKIVFWDTYSIYPNREWMLPEPHISAIKKMGGWLYAVTGTGVYRFSYSSPPKKIINDVDCIYGRNASADVFLGNQLLIGRRSNKVTSYGSSIPEYPLAVFNPFTGWEAGQGAIMVCAQAITRTVYIGTNDSKLYRQNIATSGATGLSATTNFISLPRKTTIERIKVIFGNALASGDSLNIDVSADSDDTASDFGTISFAKHGAVRRASIDGSFTAEDLQLVLNFTAGNVKIRKIEVWGTPEINSSE